MIKFLIKSVWLFAAFWLFYYFMSLHDMTKAKQLFDNQSTVSLSDNGDVYFRGFNAPSNELPIEYGQNFYKKFQFYKTELNKDILSDKSVFEEPVNIYKFQGINDSLECWFAPPNIKYVQCFTKDELNKAISRNKIFLSRLQELWKFKKFSMDFSYPTYGYLDINSFLYTQRLFHAQLVKMSNEGKTKDAVNLWLKNTTLLNNLMSSKYDFVHKAVFMKSLDYSRNTIIRIVDFSQISDSTYQDIRNSLSKPAFGSTGFNIKKTTQANYNIIIHHFIAALENGSLFEKIKMTPFIAPNFLQSEYAQYASDIINLENFSDHGFFLEFKKIEDTYYNKYPLGGWGSLKFLAYATTPKLVLGGVYKPELIKIRYLNMVRNKMVVLALEIRKNKILKDDVQKFLNNQNQELTNPITEKPFLWDGTEIYFIDPNDSLNLIKMTP